MAYTPAGGRASNKYAAKNYERIALQVKKGQREIIQAHAAQMGESVNGFIGRAIREAIERDRSACIPSSTDDA